jgi:hypothetical protein
MHTLTSFVSSIFLHRELGKASFAFKLLIQFIVEMSQKTMLTLLTSMQTTWI